MIMNDVFRIKLTKTVLTSSNPQGLLFCQYVCVERVSKRGRWGGGGRMSEGGEESCMMGVGHCILVYVL